MSGNVHGVAGERKGRTIGALGEQIDRGEVDGGQNPSRFGVNIGNDSRKYDYCQVTVPEYLPFE